MEIKKRFIECYIPCSICNLQCEYCYVIQQNRRKDLIENLKYPVDRMVKGLTKNRLGGTCYFSICAVGETLLPDYIIPLVRGILANGHFVNITNNGTATKRIEQLCELDSSLLKHLHFSFSFHYLELKKRNLIDVFFNNIQRVKKAGCSFILKLNLCDSYIAELDNIKKICLEKLGQLPVVSITRKQLPNGKMDLFTNDKGAYIKAGNSFNSKMFSFTNRFFNERRKEFCYAGDWAFLLNFETGVMSKCYSNPEGAIDIFKDINRPIRFEAIGRHCKSGFCVNADHFISQGIIPSVKCDGYADIRTDGDRSWYSADFCSFVNQKLYDYNKQYGWFKKMNLNLRYFILRQKKRLSKMRHK